MKKIICLLMSLCITGGLTSFADDINIRKEVYRGNPVTVRVEFNKVTEVVFSEEIAKIIRGSTPDTLLVEVSDSSIYLLPKQKKGMKSTVLYVITKSGQNYPINLTAGKGHDTRVTISSPDDGLIGEKRGQSQKNQTINLIRKLVLGVKPAGATETHGNMIVFNNRGLILTLKVLYDLPNCSAYILEAENLLDRAIIIPIQEIEFPNLKAITTDRDMLASNSEEGSVTNIYMVVGK